LGLAESVSVQSMTVTIQVLRVTQPSFGWYVRALRREAGTALLLGAACGTVVGLIVWLWQESGRYLQYGPELLRFRDRNDRAFVLGPTHEEVITDLARNELHSYKQLPVNFYQVQIKFRDEIRPRFGVMRSREFIMKDAYSFHVDQASLQETYDVMYDTYCRIFTRLGLNFRPVQADTGSIGGTGSHEFHVLAASGEDDIAFSDSSDYAANTEMAEALAPATPRPVPAQVLAAVDTPNVHSIDEVAAFLKVAPSQTAKTLIVRGQADEKGKYGLVALVLRGDHELNEIKAEKLPQVGSPLTLASESEIVDAVGCKPGSIGPQGLKIPVLVDRSARESGLAQSLTGSQPSGDGGLRVQLEKAPFNAMVTWLARLAQTNGVRVESASVDMAGEPGLVNAGVVLRGH